MPGFQTTPTFPQPATSAGPPLTETGGLNAAPTVELLAAEVAALQAAVESLQASQRAANDAASAVAALQAQMAGLVGHTHQIGAYQYTVSQTTGVNFEATTTTWTLPAIACTISGGEVGGQVEVTKPVNTGPPQAPATGF